MGNQKQQFVMTGWISHLDDEPSEILVRFQDDEKRILEEIADHESSIVELRKALAWVGRDAVKFAREIISGDDILTAMKKADGG